MRILWCFSNSPPHSCLFFIDGDTCFAFLHRNRRRRKRSLSLAHFAAVIKGFTPCARDLLKKIANPACDRSCKTNQHRPAKFNITACTLLNYLAYSREIPRLNGYMRVYIVSQLSAARIQTHSNRRVFETMRPLMQRAFPLKLLRLREFVFKKCCE